ncbi:MAG: SLC13 family permease [bacterium]
MKDFSPGGLSRFVDSLKAIYRHFVHRGLQSDLLKKILSIFLAGAVWTAIMLVPSPEGLTLEGQQAIALLGSVLVLFATEAISLPAIGLLIPVYQVTVTGIPVETVTNWMMSNALLFLMGNLMLAAAITSIGLDKRIALIMLSFVGANVYSIVFGLVSMSAFLAGFMSNAAAALMLAPVMSMLSILKDSTDKKLPGLSKLLIFAVGFGATAGSPYTPAGGARNVIMMDYLAQITNIQVSFLDWFIYTIPYTIVMIPLLTFVLPKIFPPEITDLSAAIENLAAEVRERPLNLPQIATLIVFLITLVLWVRVGDLFGIGIIAVGSAAFLLVLSVVEWRDYQENVDWGVLIIYLGAISLGGYTAETGAARWAATAFLESYQKLGIGADVFLISTVSVLTTAMTSLMSAGAATSVLGPIILEIAVGSQIAPLIMGLAVALASSFGFILIVSTPVNAIIYSSGYLSIKDFIKAGTVCTLVAFAVFLGLVLFYWPMLI